jgi:hypothetical protein
MDYAQNNTDRNHIPSSNFKHQEYSNQPNQISSPTIDHSSFNVLNVH